ncbi:MAG: ABC transporter permease subunit [Caldicoprobacterales bacterium]|jgi:ABC-2 type transport system permease protein
MKGFVKQIKYEIKNIIKSKFLFIISILLLVTAVVLPVFNLISSKKAPDGIGDYYPMPIVATAKRGIIERPVYPGMDNETITIDGITIDSSNPFFWNLSSIVNEMEYIENDKDRFDSIEALDLTLSLMEAELQYYLKFAQVVTDYTDYRTELAWRGMQSVYDKFIFENISVPEEILLESLNYRMGMDPEMLKNKYLEISSEEQLAALDKAEEDLAALFNILENNDFTSYIELRIEQEKKTIEDLKEQIAIQEEEIIKNPSQEDIINDMIMELKRQITNIEENTIPILQLRLERNIIPGENTWQNRAISDIENNRQFLSYNQIVTEEEFRQQPWLVQQYKTYTRYVEAMQAQIDEYKNAILIAEQSIEADKPDMKYVPKGSRYRTVQFLNYSVFITLFAVLIGGWLIASEFQQGTIRLLMIRPKSRIKILMAKFISAIVICVIIYISGSLLNAVTNGICFGFSDFAFPNYTISGEINFVSYYLPKMLACIIPIIFGYSFAFLLSVLIKNAAVAIAIPVAGFIGGSILMATLSYGGAARWIAYTPLPYMQLSSIFIQDSLIQYYIRNGMPINLTYGIMLMIVLSAIFVILSSVLFEKRDILH